MLIYLVRFKQLTLTQLLIRILEVTTKITIIVTGGSRKFSIVKRESKVLVFVIAYYQFVFGFKMLFFCSEADKKTVY